MVERPHQQRGGDGIVDDQGHRVPMRRRRDGLQIADISRRIPHRFAEYGPRLAVDQRLDVRRAIRFREAHLDAHFRQNVSEQRVGRPVQLRHRHDVAAGFGHVQGSVVDGRLPRGHAQRCHAAFEQRHAFLQDGRGRIADPRIPVSIHLEIEQRRAMLRAVERIGRRLVYGHGDGLGRGIGVESSVDCNGFALHFPVPSLRCIEV